MSRAAALLIGALCLAAVAVQHNDDSDAQLYSVVARNMATDGTWFDLRYVGNVHPTFREHLPFGLWPGALVVRAAGVGALPALAALISLGTLALVGVLAWRLTRNQTVAALSVVFLATTEQFTIIAASHRLDGPLIACALAAVVPMLTAEKPRLGDWWLVALAVCGATLIKGPFGAVLLAAAGLARAFVDRDWRWLAFGASAGIAGSLALIGFLWHERTLGSEWWSGYVEHQLLASATGARTDSDPRPLVPVVSVLEHFWPWLPLVALFAFRAWKERTREQRLLALTTLLSLGVLLLPTRKLWHHVLIVFPLLAISAGLAVAPWVERWKPKTRRLALVLVGVLGVATFFVLQRTRSASCTVFADDLRGQTGRISVTHSGVAHMWKEISTIALEHPTLEPWLVGSNEQLQAQPGRWALVADDVPVDLQGWTVVRSAKHWRLLRRD